MSVNKKVIGLIAIIVAIFCTLSVILFVYLKPSAETVEIPDVAEEEKVAGYRYDLSDKEEQMLRQYSLDMNNDYGLTVTQCYIEDISDTSILMHIQFDDAHYLGEIEYNEGADWVARLKEVTN